jgi:hypothetical protein
LGCAHGLSISSSFRPNHNTHEQQSESSLQGLLPATAAAAAETRQAAAAAREAAAAGGVVQRVWRSTPAAEGDARLPCCFDALGGAASCWWCGIQQHSEAILRIPRNV